MKEDNPKIRYIPAQIKPALATCPKKSEVVDAILSNPDPYFFRKQAKAAQDKEIEDRKYHRPVFKTVRVVKPDSVIITKLCPYCHNPMERCHGLFNCYSCKKSWSVHV